MKLKSIDISKLISVAGSPGDEGVVKNWVPMVNVHVTSSFYESGLRKATHDLSGVGGTLSPFLWSFCDTK